MRIYNYSCNTKLPILQKIDCWIKMKRLNSRARDYFNFRARVSFGFFFGISSDKILQERRQIKSRLFNVNFDIVKLPREAPINALLTSCYKPRVVDQCYGNAPRRGRIFKRALVANISGTSNARLCFLCAKKNLTLYLYIDYFPDFLFGAIIFCRSRIISKSFV